MTEAECGLKIFRCITEIIQLIFRDENNIFEFSRLIQHVAGQKYLLRPSVTVE